MAPDVSALSFKLKAESSISGIALPCKCADGCQRSTNTLQSRCFDRFKSANQFHYTEMYMNGLLNQPSLDTVGKDPIFLDSPNELMQISQDQEIWQVNLYFTDR